MGYGLVAQGCGRKEDFVRSILDAMSRLKINR